MRLIIVALLFIATAAMVVAHRCPQCEDIPRSEMFKRCYPASECPGDEKYCFDRYTRPAGTYNSIYTMGCVNNCPKGKQGCKGNPHVERCYYCRPASR